MPRTARVIIPGIAHHIVQRGNNQQVVFEEERDFRHYCYWINKYADKYQVAILAYCLMSNHVHFIIVPEDREGGSRLFQTAHTRYAQYVNNKKQQSGHLWQGRFFSCVLDDAHLFCALRYVEQNPVRAQMVPKPWDYKWSSARWHVRKPVEHYIRVTGTKMIDKNKWQEFLSSSEKQDNEKLRKVTYKGKAFADEIFIQYWEHKLGCDLTARNSGRSKSKKKEEKVSVPF